MNKIISGVCFLFCSFILSSSLYGLGIGNLGSLPGGMVRSALTQGNRQPVRRPAPAQQPRTVTTTRTVTTQNPQPAQIQQHNAPVQREVQTGNQHLRTRVKKFKMKESDELGNRFKGKKKKDFKIKGFRSKK